MAEEFDWDSAIVGTDERFEYGETFFVALGYIDQRLYSLIFVIRDETVRVISLRKANKRELSDYERKREHHRP